MIRCDLNALTPEERALHGKQTKILTQSAIEAQVLPTGYRIKFNPAETSAATILDWISHERRCCPFLKFQLEFEPEAGPLFLSLTGPEGTKEILKGAFAQVK